jgi:hypothetical protein
VFASAGTEIRVADEEYAGRYWHVTASAEDAKGGRLITSMLAATGYHVWARMCTDQQNIIAGAHLYFKGHSTLVRFPEVPPNQVRFWAGEGDDGPNANDWNAFVCGDVEETGDLKGVENYAPPEFHLDYASPFAVMVSADQRWKGGRGQSFEGPAEPVAVFAVLPPVGRPVPRRRGVQAGRLAGAADAGLQLQLSRP